jgi:23S rRNA pseudouridine2605 synthase
MQDRLQKILARAGIASRRSAERLIEAGRVRVNGKTVTELGSRADARSDRIEVDGKRIVSEDPVYILLHKPRAVMSTLDDPEGRPTVADILKALPLRVFPVGRLDYQTSGALLLTNDGDFTARMLHPRHHVPKTYLVKVKGEMEKDDAAKWRDGVMLEDGPTLPTEIILSKREAGHTWFELIMREGRNQQIRRMGEATGFPVVRLTRLAFAGIGIDALRAGQWRFLSNSEMRDLRSLYGVPKHMRTASAAHAEFSRTQPELGRSAPRAMRAPEGREPASPDGSHPTASDRNARAGQSRQNKRTTASHEQDQSRQRDSARSRKPSKPSRPSESRPSSQTRKPSESRESRELRKPSRPSESRKPSRPADSSESRKPSESRESRPSSQSRKPSRPADSSESRKPSESRESRPSSQSRKPSRPADSSESRKPSHPSESRKPSRSSESHKPSRPSESSESTRPRNSQSTGKPSSPRRPTSRSKVPTRK